MACRNQILNISLERSNYNHSRSVYFHNSAGGCCSFPLLQVHSVILHSVELSSGNRREQKTVKAAWMNLKQIATLLDECTLHVPQASGVDIYLLLPIINSEKKTVQSARGEIVTHPITFKHSLCNVFPLQVTKSSIRM